ncbi:hypothetical protein XELAEV_18037856mg [Xenopus laevis]|uniref:Uncharacterized protein n=1 Tax=Xenopus laevis TaxID=8355 RepID=A0A974CD24_XENLA|nr:hypothetical protein XELAEV_18037856mg [Xenopus laevis]
MINLHFLKDEAEDCAWMEWGRCGKLDLTWCMFVHHMALLQSVQMDLVCNQHQIKGSFGDLLLFEQSL